MALTSKLVTLFRPPPTSRRTLGVVVTLLLVPGAVLAEAHVSPVLRVPDQPVSSHAVAWDTLKSLERSQEWAASESLATDFVQQLESVADTDSLDLSRALLFIANARTKLRIHADGKGFAALERAIAIRERNAPVDDPVTLWAHVLGATFYTEAGKPDLASTHAATAIVRLTAQAPPDSSLLAQAWLGQATALSALGRLDEARGAYEEALALRQALDGPTSRSLVPMLAEYGLFLSGMGEFDRARELLHQAVSISEQDTVKRSDFLAGSLSRLSTVENRAGNIAESLDLAQRAYAVTVQKEGETSVQALRTRTVVAYRLIDLGDPRGAAGLLREIVPEMTAALGATHPHTVTARLSLVECLLDCADTTNVARELETAREAIAAKPQLASSNGAYCSMLTADLEHLRHHDASAGEILQAAIHTEWERKNPLGDTLALLYARAMNLVIEPSQRNVVIRMGEEIDRLRDRTTVRATPEWANLLTSRAGAEARVGLRDDAWAHALDAEGRARLRMQYQLQALPDASALRLAQQLSTPCEVLARLARADHRKELAAAWDRVVRWRGLVRYEIDRRRPAMTAATDSTIAAAHARWLAAQRHLGQLIVSGAANPEDPETADRFEAARRTAEETERQYVHSARGSVVPAKPPDLRHVLATLGPEQALVAFAIASTGLAEGPADARVSDDERTSGAWGSDRTLGAFVATGRDSRVRWLSFGPTVEVAREVNAWTSRLATPPTTPEQAAEEEQICRRLGKHVRNHLWDPIRVAVGDVREIFLVEEGPVVDLPWLALPDGQNTYVSDALIVLHSLLAERDLLASARSTLEPVGRGLLAIGDPDFASTPAHGSAPLVISLRAHQWPCGGTRAVALPALPAARREVEDLARTWPAADGEARVLVGAEAGEAQFKELAPGHAVIHLATHGIMVDESCGFGDAETSDATLLASPERGVGGLTPLGPRAQTSQGTPTSDASASSARPWLGRQVWLALAGAGRPPSQARAENEGLLTAEEVVTLDLRGTQWVVLSACHSGVASTWAGEGVLSMRRAFHLAGAHAVIASRWPIDDEATREWMAALYAARARGAAAGAAVAEACRASLDARRQDGRSTHPFYWAAFSASGE